MATPVAEFEEQLLPDTAHKPFFKAVEISPRFQIYGGALDNLRSFGKESVCCLYYVLDEGQGVPWRVAQLAGSQHHKAVLG